MEIVIKRCVGGHAAIRKPGQHKTKIIMCLLFSPSSCGFKAVFQDPFTGFWQQNLKVSTTLAETGYL